MSPSPKVTCTEVPCLACLAGKQRDGCLCLLSGQNALEYIVTVFMGGGYCVVCSGDFGKALFSLIFHRWPLRTCESNF